jgi:ribosomal protein S12 methylthiotransferase
MAIQEQIASELSEAKVGQTFKTIIDRVEGDYYIGRTQFDSPEVDPEVLIQKDDKPLEIGQFYQVQITQADEFDLYGKVMA